MCKISAPKTRNENQLNMNVQKMGPTDCFEMEMDTYVLLLKQCVCVWFWLGDSWRLQFVKSLQCDKSTMLCFIASTQI